MFVQNMRKLPHNIKSAICKFPDTDEGNMFIHGDFNERMIDGHLFYYSLILQLNVHTKGNLPDHLVY